MKCSILLLVVCVGGAITATVDRAELEKRNLSLRTALLNALKRSDCRDVSPTSACVEWKKEGLCEDNDSNDPRMWNMWCRETCDNCGEAEATEEAEVEGEAPEAVEEDVERRAMNAAPLKRQEDEVCKDDSTARECANWKSLGSCENHPPTANTYCRKTCGTCQVEAGATEAVVEDVERRALNTAPLKRQEDEVVVEQEDEVVVDEVCKDDSTARECANWKSLGSCENHPPTANTYCRKTCGTCQAPAAPEEEEAVSEKRQLLMRALSTLLKRELAEE